MYNEIEMLERRIRNLENVLMDLVVAVEQGLHIDYSEKLQNLVTEAKSVIDGEFED